MHKSRETHRVANGISSEKVCAKYVIGERVKVESNSSIHSPWTIGSMIIVVLVPLALAPLLAASLSSLPPLVATLSDVLP